MGEADPELYFTLADAAYGIGVLSGEATIGSLHTITLGTDITANATSAAQGKRITLGYSGSVPQGFVVAYSVNGSPIEGDCFMMPDENVTVSSGFKGIPISTTYVDAGGTVHDVQAFPLDNTMTTLPAGTYVVNNDVSFTGTVTLTGDVTLILGDGYTMNFGTEELMHSGQAIVGKGVDLTIYGQSSGTGYLKIYSYTGHSILLSYGQNREGGGFIQHSGNVFVRQAEQNSRCISCIEFVLDGGTCDVYSAGTPVGGDISAKNKIDVLGGQLRSSGKGLSTIPDGTITLGCTNDSDRISATVYRAKKVMIADGQALDDGDGNVYSGTLFASQITLIGSQTLKTYTPASEVAIALTRGVKDGVSGYWGTFYNLQRYVLPEGAAAYTMDSEHHLYRLGADGRVIPARVPVVIIADKAALTLDKSDDTSAVADNAPGGNILQGCSAGIQISDFSGPIFVLGIADGDLVFFRLTGTGYIPAGKAYYTNN